jgi:hypothetical protein
MLIGLALLPLLHLGERLRGGHRCEGAGTDRIVRRSAVRRPGQGPRAFADERAWQAQWLAQALALRD